MFNTFFSIRAVLNAEKEEQLTNLFLQYSQAYQQDLKAVGIILLQLVQHHVFTDKEIKHWQSWMPTFEDHPNFRPPQVPLTNKMKNKPPLTATPSAKAVDLTDNESVRSHHSHHSDRSKEGTISLLSQSISGGDAASATSNRQNKVTLFKLISHCFHIPHA